MRIDRNQFIKDLDAVKRHFSHVAKKDEIKRNYDQIDIIVGLYERLTGKKWIPIVCFYLKNLI